MPGWTLTFLMVSLLAAALGFGGIAGAATGIAKVLSCAFFAAFLLSLLRLVRRRRRAPAA